MADKNIAFLEDFITLLETEKAALMNNDSKEISKIIEEKKVFVEVFPTIDFSKEDRKKVEQAVAEIQELQKTNLLLTKQSIQFIESVMDAFNDGVKKANKTYSKDGHHTGASQANLLNQSL